MKIIMALVALAVVCGIIYIVYTFGAPAAAMMKAATPPPGSAYSAPPPGYGPPPAYGYSQMNDLMSPPAVMNAAKAFARKR
jgi:hypothetical protein